METAREESSAMEVEGASMGRDDAKSRGLAVDGLPDAALAHIASYLRAPSRLLFASCRANSSRIVVGEV